MTRKPALEPDEFGLVGVVQRHQQLGVFPDVTDKVLQVHEQAVGVHCAEKALAPHLQVLKPHLRRTHGDKNPGVRSVTAGSPSWTFSSWIRSSTLREAVS